MSNKVWSKLFELGESTCFTKTPYGTSLSRIFTEEPHQEQYFSINPLRVSRKDANVTCFRNFLIEFDNLPLEEQTQKMASIPYTSAVFSGGKSIHFIISLETPLKTIEEYKNIAYRLQQLLPDMDKACSNPSRLSRTPEAFRDNGIQQHIVNVNEKVRNEDLLKLLPEIKQTPMIVMEPESKKRLRVLTPFTNYYLAFGEIQNRNNTLFRVACDMFRAGYTQDEILHKIAPVNSLTHHETMNCIRSAYRAIRSQL